MQRLAQKHSLVIVPPDGGKAGWSIDSPLQDRHRYHSYLFKELLPELDDRLPLNGKRGIAGFSMGGHGAFFLALRHPGLFRSVSSMSGVLDLTRLRR